MGSNQERRKVGTKYVIACDGTWQNSDQGYEDNAFAPPTAQIPSNVTRIVRSLKHVDDYGTRQIAFYQRGIGSNGGEEDKLIGGATGVGLSEHVREAYGFLVNNFTPETQADVLDLNKPMDEIIILGFSRGAFTARAISSLISDIGLLTHEGMESFWGIFGDWMKQNIEGRKSEWFKSQFGECIPFTNPKYREKLIEKKLTRWPVPIRAVGVWDTVGALGVPYPWKDKNVKEYSFVNQKVSQQVEHAFHAIALDEHRRLFSPTLWEWPQKPNLLQTLKQCWFPGVHSNIGGSYADAGISNITLAWMISQLEDTEGGILAFNPDYLDWLQDMNNKFYVKTKEPIRPWGMGMLYDSAPVTDIKGAVQSLLPVTRTPGRYDQVSDETGEQTKVLLRNTGECIHPCVRVRMNGDGPPVSEDSEISKLFRIATKFAGLSSGSKYNSAALKNWELVQSPAVKVETDHARVGPSGVYWRAKDGTKDGVPYLPEETLGRTELRLLKRSVDSHNTNV